VTVPSSALSLLCLLFTVLSASNARSQENQTERKIGLYSDDEKTVIEYLKDHRIPHATGQPSGPGPNYPPYRREVKRALELFEIGSHELGLAIVRSLPIYSESGTKCWEKCGAEDYEAKHYLVGLALAAAKPEQRDEIRDWLINKADPSYATALLKNLKYYYFRHLSEGANEAQQNQLLGLLMELYRQKGHVVIIRALPGDYERKEVGGPVQKYVVQLLPGTPAGSKVLLDWITRDRKKVDDATLTAMWRTWKRCHFEDVEAISKRRDVAESWLLCPVWYSGLHLDESAFKKNVCSQVFNPDPKVRTRALEYVIQGGARHPLAKDKADRNAGFDAIREASATKAMRSRALEEAKAMYAELLEKNKKQPSLATGLRRDFAKLAEALSPR